MPEQVEPTADSPEDLLRRLDLELAGQRARRERTQGQRAALLAGGVLLILVLAAGALMIAFSMLNDLAVRDRHADSPPAPTGSDLR